MDLTKITRELTLGQIEVLTSNHGTGIMDPYRVRVLGPESTLIELEALGLIELIAYRMTVGRKKGKRVIEGGLRTALGQSVVEELEAPRAR